LVIPFVILKFQGIPFLSLRVCGYAERYEGKKPLYRKAIEFNNLTFEKNVLLDIPFGLYTVLQIIYKR
jgi:hypothetical protein